MTDAELTGLLEATYKVEQTAPGLPAWGDSACVWQLQQRTGYHYELQEPEAAIPPEEDAVSIEATYAMRASFTASDMAPAALRFFDALLELILGVGRKH